MAQDITFVLKARNEARRAVKALGGDFDSVAKNASKLEKDTDQAAKATEGLGKNTEEAAKQAEELAGQTEEVAKQASLAAKAFGLLAKAAAAVGAAIASVGAGALTALIPALLPARIRAVVTGFVLLSAAIAGIGIFVGAAQSARSFNAALAETSTLIQGTPTQLGDLTDATRSLVREFGGTKTSQIQAFYQAISAGAATIPQATEIVTQANKLAVGGVTDVSTGVDILTTAVNAYGPSVITATEASDALFVAMQAGKTTIGELATSLGAVIPLAVTTGVSFDELVGATSALTTQGIDTGTAVTQLRGILQAVIKPTSEAVKAAKDLDVAFNVAALSGEGLQAFLQSLSDASGGSAEELAKLFGSVEALGGVLALTGGGSDAFATTLENLEQKAGATDVAFQKVAENLDQRLTVALASLAESFTRLGQIALTVLVPAMEAIAKVVEVVADNFDIVVVAVLLFASRALPAAAAAAVSLTRSLFALNTTATLTGRIFTILRLAVTGQLAALVALVTGAGQATLAMRALGLAMRAIPFIAVATLVVGVFRAFTGAQESAQRLKESVQDVTDSFGGLEAALAVFAVNAGRSVAEALLKSTEASIVTLKKAITDAEKELADAEFKTNIFGVNLFETTRIKEARAVVEELNIALAETEAKASAASARIDGFNLANNGTAEQVRAIAQAQGLVGEATFNTLPPVQELRAEYGNISGTVREALILTQELAIVNGQISFGNALAEASKFLDNTSLSANEVGRINQELVNLRSADNMGDASRKALKLAQEIIKGAGGVKQLDANTRQAVEKLVQAALQAANVDRNARSAAGSIASAAGAAVSLANNLNAAAGALAAVAAATASLDLGSIGLEATNAAIAKGKSQLEARAAGTIAQKRAELSDAFGSGDGIIRAAAAAELDDFTASVVRNSEAQRENLELVKSNFSASSGPSSGGFSGSGASGGGAGAGAGAGGGGGGGGGGGDSDPLGDAIQQQVQGYRDEIELLGLYGEELEFAKNIQELQNIARQEGTELTAQQIELLRQESEALKEATRNADTFTNGLKAGLAQINENLQSTVSFTRDFVVSAFNGMSDAIVDFVTTGKADFKGLLTDLLKQLSKFLADRLLANFLNAFGAGLGGGIGGSTFLGTSVGLAQGGYVSGKGGPTQDNLLRFLSNGEFVTNARATSQYGPLLEAINAGRGDDMMGRMYSRAYEAGGQAGEANTLMALRASNSSPQATREFAPNINFNFPGGDADSFRRSEGQVRARMSRLMQDADNRNN